MARGGIVDDRLVDRALGVAVGQTTREAGRVGPLEQVGGTVEGASHAAVDVEDLFEEAAADPGAGDAVVGLLSSCQFWLVLFRLKCMRVVRFFCLMEV